MSASSGSGCHRPLALLCVAALLGLAAACGGSSGTKGPATDPNNEGTKVKFDSANFVDPTRDTNPYHPLKPGMQWVRGGTTEVGARVLTPGYALPLRDAVLPIVLVFVATVVSAVAASRLVSRLEPTELLRDE